MAGQPVGSLGEAIRMTSCSMFSVPQVVISLVRALVIAVLKLTLTSWL